MNNKEQDYKYLKLIVEPALPEGCHITFVYFGKDKTPGPEWVCNGLLADYLCFNQQFKLQFDRMDMFGPNNDIPVAVFNYTSNAQSVILARNKIMNELNVKDRNRETWVPHISNPGVEFPRELKVIGIESNLGNESWYFNL